MLPFPKYLDSIKANEKLSNTFDMNATHMVLADADLSSKEAKEMLQEMSDVKGVKFALGLDSLLGSSIPRDMIPGELTETLKQGDWQLILVQSEYKAATDEVNKQCTELNKIIKSLTNPHVNRRSTVYKRSDYNHRQRL